MNPPEQATAPERHAEAPAAPGSEGRAPSPAPTDLASALASQEERLLTCVHCGFCLPACPTYTRLGMEGDSPRGRLHLMRAVVEDRLDPASNAFQLHIDRCLGCRACETVCPSGVEYGSLLERAREEAARAKRPGLLTRLLLRIFASDRATSVAMAGGRLMRATGLPALAARLLPDVRPLEGLRLAMGMLAATTPWRPSPRDERAGDDTEAPARREDRPRHRSAARSPSLAGGSDPDAGAATAPASAARTDREAGDEAFATDLALLRGCVQEGLLGEVNRATERVLGANGYRMHPVAAQGCCGALHVHGGALETARTLARRNVDAFEMSGVERIVVNSAGCGAVMKEYGDLLADDPLYALRAAGVASRVRDVSELLAARGPVPGGPLPLTVTYDAPCHLLHGQGIETPPLAVLAAIPELEVVALRGADECCGGAGLYGITHPDLGGRIGRDKVAAVEETGARVVATGNPGCIMQIGAGLRMTGSGCRAMHPVELLDESYRRAGRYR
ncbi:MAG: 4Fe-4S dicluster domain-containing protein [Gemmatimonadetes bacterium]|nr:4Fe-4S dicluster domain-containing protein [Gemmatimonadota bacterium]